jgi:hypothetical protein
MNPVPRSLPPSKLTCAACSTTPQGAVLAQESVNFNDGPVLPTA